MSESRHHVSRRGFLQSMGIGALRLGLRGLVGGGGAVSIGSCRSLRPSETHPHRLVLDHYFEHQFPTTCYFELKDHTIHTMRFYGVGHDQQQNHIAPILSELPADVVKQTHYIFFHRPEDFHKENVAGDAHHYLDTICVKHDWKPSTLVHELAHNYDYSLTSSQRESFAAISHQKYGQHLGPYTVDGKKANKWAKDIDLPSTKKGPAFGFVCAYAANSPVECWAEITESLFILSHKDLCESNVFNPYPLIALNPDQHSISDHNARVSLVRELGGVTQKMYEDYEMLIQANAT